jgi:RNA polymerase sigma factor (sigma-70 family)
MEMNEYNVQIKVRNNYLLQAMRAKEIYTVAQLSRASGVHQGLVGQYLNLKRTPLNQMGVIRPDLVKICEVLGCLVEELFPAAHLYLPLENNKGEVSIGLEEMQGLIGVTDPDLLLEEVERTGLVSAVVSELTPRQQEVLTLRMGLDGEGTRTMAEVAEKIGISASRAAQIEAKALRRLRHPDKSGLLRDFL